MISFYEAMTWENERNSFEMDTEICTNYERLGFLIQDYLIITKKIRKIYVGKEFVEMFVPFTRKNFLLSSKKQEIAISYFVLYRRKLRKFRKVIRKWCDDTRNVNSTVKNGQADVNNLHIIPCELYISTETLIVIFTVTCSTYE